MKKNMKRAICSLAVLGTIVGAGLAPTKVDAASYTYKSGSRDWSKPWSASAAGSYWDISYGFNTFAINEDFTHTYHAKNNHTAGLTNNTGAFTKSATYGNKAKIEVKHNGTNNIIYGISF